MIVSTPEFRSHLKYLAVLLTATGAILLTGCDSRMRDAEQAVRATMKDPDAAQFRKLGYCGDAKTGAIIQGEVNGKNSFGAYDGFKTFHYDGATVAVEGDGDLSLTARCTAQIREATIRIRRGLARGYLQDRAAGRTPPYAGNTEAEILANMEAESQREINAILNRP